MVRIATKKCDFPFDIRDVVHLLGLRVRRPTGSSGAYADCPFCGDQRGKLYINYDKDVFRCNYCDTGGGMLDLYAKIYNISKSAARREICNALSNGVLAPEYLAARAVPAPPPVEQSPLASARDVHETLSLLFAMLSLDPRHEQNLLTRGLDGKQIKLLGYKSTPPPEECLPLVKALLNLGCTVAGVPGFYMYGDGQWTVRFNKRTAGILLPAKGMDGLVRGAQIRLDVPMEDGTKFIWFSTSGKYMGVTSGSLAHFAGNPYAKTVYVTEGILKADVAHLLMNRTFVSVPGANNLKELEQWLSVFSSHGTTLVVEAHDTDKFRNAAVNKGAAGIYAMARAHGMECKRLTWNPNYKGIDDWQLHMKNRASETERLAALSFKDRFLEGACEVSDLAPEIERWRRLPEKDKELSEFLGLGPEEYGAVVNTGDLDALLQPQRKRYAFRIYQLELTDDNEVIPFAFADISVMREKGKYDQPPAPCYRLVYESSLFCPASAGTQAVLARIRRKHHDEVPDDFRGRCIAPSDIIELFGREERRYYYCNRDGFEQVKFSPMLALPMKRGM